MPAAFVHMQLGPGRARRLLLAIRRRVRRIQVQQVRGGLTTTCPPGLQLQLHQASIAQESTGQPVFQLISPAFVAATALFLALG